MLKGTRCKRLLDRNSTSCLIKRKGLIGGEVFKVRTEEIFSHEKGVKKGFGVDSALTEYTGITVIRAFFNNKVELGDEFLIGSGHYKLLRRRYIANVYYECILYENDFINDIKIRRIETEQENGNVSLGLEEGEISALARLKTINQDNVFGNLFPHEEAKSNSHRFTVEYDEKYIGVTEGWMIICKGKKYQISSVVNFNEQDMFLTFECFVVR